MDAIFELLASRSDEHGYTYARRADLEDWALACGLDVSEFLNQFGLEVAKKYHGGERYFAFCDSLVNDLYVDMVDMAATDPEFRWTSLFFEIFEAFDAGEFHRRSDKSDDPIGEQTDPAIAFIVTRRR